MMSSFTAKNLTDDELWAINNNAAKGEMKRIAIGHKNRLTVGWPVGGQSAALMFSFTSTCQRLGFEPLVYLQDVLTRLPTMAAAQLGALLPDRWQAARQAKMATPPSHATDASTPPAESAC
jgi:hypothetical protein